MRFERDRRVAWRKLSVSIGCEPEKQKLAGGWNRVCS